MTTKDQLLQLMKDSIILGLPLPEGFEHMLFDAEKEEILKTMSSDTFQSFDAHEESMSDEYQSIIMDKDVDWSLLNYGFTIPKLYHEAFIRQSGQTLERGHSVNVAILINGETYPGTLRFPDLKGREVVQLLWKGDGLVNVLRTLYSDTYQFMSKVKAESQSKKQVELPQELKHKLVICSVKNKGVYLFVDKKN